MYQTLKKVALSIVPKKFLIENEIFFRSVFALHLHGKKHECTVCNRGLKNFINIPEGDILCPFCGSRSRTRRLYSLLNEHSLINGKILHFSPSRSVYRILKKKSEITYFSTDFEDEFLADYKYDITQIPLEKEFLDLIICYHILEHIEDDSKAMTELYRVLKKDGVCIIQTPFKEGSIYEDPLKKSKKERLEAFGQEDHVRIYSVEGLCTRLKKTGFNTIEILKLQANERYGFMEENVLIVKK